MPNYSTASDISGWRHPYASPTVKANLFSDQTGGFVSTARVALSVLRLVTPLGLAVAAFLMTFAVSVGLPVLADGSLHTQIIEQIAASGSLQTQTVSSYPPFYHVLGAQLYALVGHTGIQFISPLSVALAGLFIYLIGYELTGKHLVGICAQALAAFSPVIIQYSSTILMEPLLVAMSLFGVYALLLSTKNRSARLVLLAAIAVGAAVLSKQVGLILPVAAVLFFVASKAGWRRTSLLTVAVALIIVGPYLFMFKEAHSLINPGPVPPSLLQERSQGAIGSIVYGDRYQRLPEWSWALDEEVDSREVHSLGTRVHEQRHVYWQSLFDLSAFSNLHSLYPDRFLGYSSISRSWVLRILNLLLIAGFIGVTALSIRYPKWRVIALLMLLSYALMSMNFGSDTQRLFLYLAAISALFPVLAVWAFHKLLSSGSRNDNTLLGRTYVARAALSKGISGAIIILVLLEIAPLALDQMRVMDGMRVTQGGGFASEGGIDSIKVTGEWIRNNSSPDEGYMAASAYEWQYYSGRPDLWWQGLDYRLYFLPADRIDHYMQVSGAKFVIVRSNQLVEDANWNHIELVPVSFKDKIQQLYDEAYVSPYGDIRVYSVSSDTSSG